MIAQFALRLLLGMCLTWAVLPRREITSGFFRIQFLVALGLSVLAALTVGSLPGLTGALDGDGNVGGEANGAGIMWGTIACAALGLLAFSGSVAWTLERRRGGTAFLFAMLLGALALVMIAPLRQAETPGWRAYAALSEIASSAILGSCVTGMLLGHWYLTATGMALRPLVRANQWFAATIAVRLALAAAGLGLVRNNMAGATHAVWLTLRWGAGLILPLILTVMVSRILRYRNTQSATGVLFAAVILVFLGELAGTLLSRELGIAL